MRYVKTYELFGFNKKRSYTQSLITQDDVRQSFYNLSDEGWKVDIRSESIHGMIHRVDIKKPNGEFNTSEIYDDVMFALGYLKSKHRITLKKVELIVDWSDRGRGGVPTEEVVVSKFPKDKRVSHVILYLKVR